MRRRFEKMDIVNLLNLLLISSFWNLIGMQKILIESIMINVKKMDSNQVVDCCEGKIIANPTHKMMRLDLISNQ